MRDVREEDTKPCQNVDCEKRCVRRKKEPEQLWSKRKYCSAGCANSRWKVRHDHMIGEVEWIIGTDHPESIARRVGYAHAKDLVTLLREKGRPDLGDKLSRELSRYDAPLTPEPAGSVWYA